MCAAEYMSVGQGYGPRVTRLGIDDSAAALVDPEVLLDEAAVLEGEEAVREADQSVVSSHSSVVGGRVCVQKRGKGPCGEREPLWAGGAP